MTTKNTKLETRRGSARGSRPSPRIGLALGGGAARGWAHLGVLQALDEAGIRPVCLAGTSIGSLVGASWASGGLPDLRAAVEGLDHRTLQTFMSVAVRNTGARDGRYLQSLIRPYIKARDIRDLAVPFAAVATDLCTAREVVLREGDPVDAIRASCGVPGLFRPLSRDGRLLIDGGLVNPVPVNVARALGADLVIAVDISHHIVEDGTYLPRSDENESSAVENGRPLPAWMARFLPTRLPFRGHETRTPKVPGLREALQAALAVGEVTIGSLKLQADPPDLLICPRVGHIRFLDFTRGGEAIAAGYEATREALANWADRPAAVDDPPVPAILPA